MMTQTERGASETPSCPDDLVHNLTVTVRWQELSEGPDHLVFIFAPLCKLLSTPMAKWFHLGSF